MDKLQENINRGMRAKLALDDEVFAETMAALESEYVTAWKSTKPHETDLREKLFLAVQVMNKFKDHLIAVANDGKLAQAELARFGRKAA